MLCVLFRFVSSFIGKILLSWKNKALLPGTKFTIVPPRRRILYKTLHRKKRINQFCIWPES